MTRDAADITPPLDLTDCDREPIHIPGSIQPHGVLLVLREPDLRVRQASKNVRDLFDTDAALLVGRPLDDLLGVDSAAAMRAAVAAADSLDQNPALLLTVRTPSGVACHAVVHRHDDTLILELEPVAAGLSSGARHASAAADPYALVRSSVVKLQSARSVEALWQIAAQEVRRLTGFDRVMTYRFADNFDGEVVAEDCSPGIPPFLGHRFPASDIPAQARRLYTLNRLRLIADVAYQPVPLVPPLHPETGRPVDLSFAALRSVSPIHVEYLKNMGVGASMSISIVVDGRLWGLMACHHRTPLRVPYEARVACDFLGQLFAVQLTSQVRHSEAEHRIRLKSMLGELLARMSAAPAFTQGLAASGEDLLAFAAAGGAAFFQNGEVVRLGECPADADVAALAQWLFDRGEDVYATDTLPAAYPRAASFQKVGSGVLAVSMSRVNRNLLIWFRPEVVRTVTWSGDPHKPAVVGGDRRLHPRRSFELWKQVVRGTSLPWSPAEIEAAADLRNAIVAVVLRRAEELGKVNAELERSNRELEAFSYSVSHDLRAPFRHIVGFSDLLVKRADTLDETSRRYVSTIAESARYAGTLVDSLLAFSRMSRLEVRNDPVDLNAVVRAVLPEVQSEASGRRIEWRIDPLPTVSGDSSLLRLVFGNLLSNAVKYTRGRDVAHVHLGVHPADAGGPDAGRHVIFVRDNGVGFDMTYVGKFFGVFQRLHRAEEFEGTGIGLANVKRIVERHGGRVWAEGNVGKGATFWFTLPRT